jgi:hypothetical protein
LIVGRSNLSVCGVSVLTALRFGMPAIEPRGDFETISELSRFRETDALVFEPTATG